MAAEKLKKAIEEGLSYFRIDYDDARLSQLCLYVESLERWNRRINLIGLKEMEAVVGELIFDAFFLYTWTRDGRRILDLGSGAGILAIPLAILGSGNTVFSVDKSLKKVQFQRHVRRLLELENLSILCGRAEEIEPLQVDVLMAKAFGSVREVVEKGARHLKEEGSLLLVRGKSEKPAKEEGFCLVETQKYRLPEGRKEYQLFVYKKVP